MTLQEQWRESIAKHGKPVSPMMDVAIEVAKKYLISTRLLLGREFSKTYSAARLEFILRCKAIGKSTTMIAKFMDGRDHSTIIFYLRKARG